MNWYFSAAILFALCLVAPGADAGAWSREKGKTFIAGSGIATWPDDRDFELPDIYGSLYIEHGLGKRLTLGLELGSPDVTRKARLKTVGFLRYALSPPDKQNQFSIDGGIGTYLDKDVLRFGASFGRGLSVLERNSWVSVDANILVTPRKAKTAIALDATFGVSLKHGKIMGQLSGYQGFDKKQFLSFIPSYARDIGKGRHIEIGVVIGLHEKPDPALKIGIWQEF